MLQPLLNSSTIPLLERLAEFGERRQEVLAGNIANIDTPGYRMRDLPVSEFRQAMRQAVAQRRGEAGGTSLNPASSGRRSVESAFPSHLFRAVESLPRNLTFQDANNRSIEHQVMEMTSNSLMQQFAVELMSTQYRMLETVISERVV